MVIKAIPTRYKGYHFRSRLEARWAVFFDRMCIKYAYEHQGYDLGEAGWYLPDFEVTTPQGRTMWYEVKPAHIKTDAKAEALSSLIYEAVTNSVSEILPYSSGLTQGSVCVVLSGDPMEVLRVGSGAGKHALCPRCGMVLPINTYMDLVDEAGVGCWSCDFETCSVDDPAPGLYPYIRVTPHKGILLTPSTGYARLAKRWGRAAKAARSARFEHGHSGAS